MPLEQQLAQAHQRVSAVEALREKSRIIQKQLDTLEKERANLLLQRSLPASTVVAADSSINKKKNNSKNDMSALTASHMQPQQPPPKKTAIVRKHPATGPLPKLVLNRNTNTQPMVRNVRYDDEDEEEFW